MMRIEMDGMVEVIAGLEDTVNDIVQRAEAGLVKCQILLKREAMRITPWRTGHLSGSYISPPPTTLDGQRMTATVENAAEYAVYVHEMPETTNWNKPGTGPKFMQRPLFENADRFLEIIRNEASV